MEMRLQDLADSARDLLECEQVCISLTCPEADLRHPLLSLFWVLHVRSPFYYGTVLDSTLLSEERVWAAYDKAVLLGQPIIEEMQTSPGTCTSIMIATLERPAGIVGLLFCTSKRAGAFLEGERHLLAQYRSELAWQVEQILSESCTAFSMRSDTENHAPGIQEQNTFLSLISHELRAPLMAIKGYTGLLQEYGIGQEGKPGRIHSAQQRRYLAVIMEQVKHLEVLIGDVLDVSHLQAGRLALRCTRVDLNLLCQYMVQLMQFSVNKNKSSQYTISCSVEPGLPLVWADADRVQQVLTNLVDNAIKYSPEGGLIRIRICLSTSCTLNCPCQYRGEKWKEAGNTISPNAAFVCITVSDQGIGIPSQQQASLFKPFTRLEHAETHHISGTGLGLYIARELVEAMNGQVFLRSREGQGTTITFTLPIAYIAVPQPHSEQSKYPLAQTIPTH